MFRFVNQFFRITLVEWRTMLRDPACMLIIVVGVLLYAFYYPYPYKEEVANKAPAAIVDENHSAMSRQIIQMASAAQEDTIVAVLPQESEAQKLLADESIYCYLKIPEGTEAELRKGNNVSLGVYCHGAFILLYGNIATSFAMVAGSVGATTQVKHIALRGNSVAQAKAIRDPIPTRFFRMFNQSGGYGIYAVSAVLMIILQQTCLIGVCVMGGARRNRKFKLLKNCEDTENAPLISRYFGRSLAFVLHYLVALFFYKFIVYHVFEFPNRGDSWLVFIFGLIFFGCVVNMGMFFAQFLKYRESALAIFASVPILVLFSSGFSWPISNMPVWIRALGLAFPSTYAIPAWLEIQNLGATFSEVAPELLKLFLLSCFYLVLGILNTIRRDELEKRGSR